MKYEVLLFATLQDLAGSDRVTVEVSTPATVRDLLASLEEAYPRLASRLPHVRVAVDREFQDPDSELTDEGVEIALIPPVSGG